LTRHFFDQSHKHLKIDISTGIILLGLILISFSPTFASISFTDNRNSISCEIESLISTQCFDQALFKADSIINLNSEDPYGYFLKATILHFRSVDFEDDVDHPEIFRICGKIQTLTGNVDEDSKSQSVKWFYLGSVELYKLFIERQSGSKLQILPTLIRAGRCFETAIELDSTCWDAYYGLGMYKYFKSSQAGILRKLGFISDQRELGLEYINLAIEQGKITSLAAKSSLIRILLEKQDYAEAIQQARLLTEKYPGTRAFMWSLGEGLSKTEDYEEAIKIYENLLCSIRSEKRNNHFNEIYCISAITSAHFELGNWEQAIAYSEQALSIEPCETVANRLKSKINEIKHIRKKASTRS